MAGEPIDRSAHRGAEWAEIDQPIAGRSEPRETTADHAFRHDLRLYGLASGEIRAVCAPCDWARIFEPGHAPYDYIRLEMQHVTGRFA